LLKKNYFYSHFLYLLEKERNFLLKKIGNWCQGIKQALIKAYKLSDNDQLNILFHKSDLGDRKPSELLSEMRQLLEAYDCDNPQTNVKAFWLLHWKTTLIH